MLALFIGNMVWTPDIADSELLIQITILKEGIELVIGREVELLSISKCELDTFSHTSVEELKNMT